MVRFSRRNGLTRSKISGLGPKTTYTPKTLKAPTPSTSTDIAPTPVSFIISYLLFIIIVVFELIRFSVLARIFRYAKGS